MKLWVTRALCWAALVALYAVAPMLGLAALAVGIGFAGGRRARSVTAYLPLERPSVWNPR